MCKSCNIWKSNEAKVEVSCQSNKSAKELSEEAERSINSSDSESHELSCNELLKYIPDFENVCSTIWNDPVNLPKTIARYDPMVYEKILQNQQVFMDLLHAQNAKILINELLEMKNPENSYLSHSEKNNEDIDRLVEKGYDRNLAQQAYQALPHVHP